MALSAAPRKSISGFCRDYSTCLSAFSKDTPLLSPYNDPVIESSGPAPCDRRARYGREAPPLSHQLQPDAHALRCGNGHQFGDTELSAAAKSSCEAGGRRRNNRTQWNNRVHLGAVATSSTPPVTPASTHSPRPATTPTLLSCASARNCIAPRKHRTVFDKFEHSKRFA